jgi:hypothetical protein
MTKDMKIVVDYCVENIWEFEERVQMALDKIDHWRCPLQQADYSLYNDIMDAITDCAIDYDIDADSIDVEDVIFA